MKREKTITPQSLRKVTTTVSDNEFSLLRVCTDLSYRPIYRTDSVADICSRPTAFFDAPFRMWLMYCPLSEAEIQYKKERGQMRSLRDKFPYKINFEGFKADKRVSMYMKREDCSFLKTRDWKEWQWLVGTGELISANFLNECCPSLNEDLFKVARDNPHMKIPFVVDYPLYIRKCGGTCLYLDEQLQACYNKKMEKRARKRAEKEVG